MYIFVERKKIFYREEGHNLLLINAKIFTMAEDIIENGYIWIKDGKIFSELVKGEKKNREFYHEILDNISLLGE